MTTSRTATRLTRILTMLPWVIAHPGATVEDVCRRFGYEDERQLARDLDMVFVCGLPGYGPGDLMVAYIDEDEVVVDTADYFEDAPRLTPAETLSTLAAAMTVLGTGQGSPELESAVDKLVATFIPDGTEALTVDMAAEPELVGTLRSAAADNRVVDMTYVALGGGRTTDRLVEPWSVFASLGNWYVTGHCRRAGDERVFRVDRIRRLDVTDETFDPPEETPPPTVSYTPSEDDVRCVIRLTQPAFWVMDYYPVEVQERGEGWAQIEFSATDASVPATLLLRLGDRADLIEGEEVERALRDLGGRILSRYR